MQERSRAKCHDLGAEAFAAGAARGGIWVVDFEPSVLKGINEVQFRACDVERAFRVNNNPDSRRLHKNVPICWGILQIHLVLQTGTSAANYSHAEHALGTSLLGEERVDFIPGTVSQFDEAFIPNPKSGSARGVFFGSRSDHSCDWLKSSGLKRYRQIWFVRSLAWLDIWEGIREEVVMFRPLGIRLLLPLLIANIAVFLSAAEPGKQSAGSFVAAIDKPISYDYLIYLPEDYKPRGEGFPLLLFLHGAGERGDNLDLVKTHGPPKLVDAGHSLPFIVVSPQCPSGEIWDAEVLLRLITSIENQYRVDSDRIYVSGLSMGGFGTWSLIARAPERFAAAAPICGGGNFIEFVLGTKAHKEALKALPIWVFHGGADSVVRVSEAYRMVSLLERGAREIKLTVYPGVGHNSWTESYDNPALYEWFLSWSH